MPAQGRVPVGRRRLHYIDHTQLQRAQGQLECGDLSGRSIDGCSGSARRKNHQSEGGVAMSVDLNRVIRGRVWKFGDSVDTDSINPYYLYPTMEELKKHTLESYRPEFPKEVKAGDILIAGRNFGCGSSRPGLVLREVGIAAIVVESASRLFLRNNIAR